MKMNEFMTALQTHLATQQPNYPSNAESILEVLFDAYNESSAYAVTRNHLDRRN